MGEVPSDAAKGLAHFPSALPPPRMTSSQITISGDEIPEVQRFLEQMRAQKAMEAGGGNQDIVVITHEFMKRELGLIRTRVEGIHTTGMLSLQQQVLAILDEHIQALE